VNQQVGRYQILNELGRGATGVVYKALDPTIGRTIAIKAIPLGEVGDAEEKHTVRERLLQEAQSAGGLSHPNIVTIYDILESAEFVHILMEYIDGDSLQDLRQSDAVPAHRELLPFLRQIAEGLDYAHRKGIVHRDIKPANILISKQQPEGERFAKIADFGVASFVAREPAQTGATVIGTPNYMSPEQIQGLAVTGASDQFALGAIVYELLTGEKPFNAEGLPALFYQICKQTPKSVESLNPALHSTVGEVMNRVLSKDPAQRFASCGDFIGALASGLSESPEWLRAPAAANVPAMVAVETVPTNVAAAEMAAGAGVAAATAVASAPVQAAAIPKPNEPPVEIPKVLNVELPEGLKAAVEKQVKAEASRPGTPRPVPVSPSVATSPKRELSRPGDPPFVLPPRTGPVLSGWERRERRSAASRDVEADSSRGKFWLILALCLAVGAAALFIIRWNSGAIIPTQVLDTKTGPTSPPPVDSGKIAQQTPAPVAQPPQHPPADLNPAPASDAPAPAAVRETPPTAEEQQPQTPPVQTPQTAVATPEPKQPPPPAQEAPTVPRERAVPERAISDVELVTDPPGAKITIDGNPRLTCTAPCALNLPAGRHTMVAELSGYALMRKIFNAPVQDNVFVSLEQNMGVLFLATIPPGSPVSVDGQARGVTPLTLKLPAGPHRLTLFDGAQRRHDETIEIDAQGMNTRTFTWQR
jgi:eukaryotic-like serine/threonine-protein kinase